MLGVLYKSMGAASLCRSMGSVSCTSQWALCPCAGSQALRPCTGQWALSPCAGQWVLSPCTSLWARCLCTSQWALHPVQVHRYCVAVGAASLHKSLRPDTGQRELDPDLFVNGNLRNRFQAGKAGVFCSGTGGICLAALRGPRHGASCPIGRLRLPPDRGAESISLTTPAECTVFTLDASYVAS